MRRSPHFGLLPAFLLAEDAEPAVGAADPPHRALRYTEPGGLGFIGQKPVAEFRVVAVGVEQGVGQMRPVPLGVGHGLVEPAAVGRASDVEDPARHRDGDTVGGQLTDERVDHFPGRCACER